METKTIGTISLSDNKKAILDMNGRWHCENKEIETVLNRAYNPSTMGGVSVILPFGVQAVMEGAAAFRGNAKLSTPLPPVKEGVVY